MCQWCFKLLSKVGYDFHRGGLSSQCWDWFIEQDGGFELFLHSYKRHPEMISEAISYLMQFSQGRLNELFRMEVKKRYGSPLEYTNFINDFLFQFIENGGKHEI